MYKWFVIDFRAITDVFEWIFEVDEDAYGDDRGRINILLEYEKMTNQKDFSQPVENRLVARVEIQRDNIFSIVPVVKVDSYIWSLYQLKLIFMVVCFQFGVRFSSLYMHSRTNWFIWTIVTFVWSVTVLVFQEKFPSELTVAACKVNPMP